MNRLIPFLAGVLLWASSVQAQDKTYTLTVTTQDLQVLSAGLDELQRKISEPVVEKLQKQLIPQMQQPVPPPAAATPPPAASHVDVPAAEHPAEPFDPKAHPSF